MEANWFEVLARLEKRFGIRFRDEDFGDHKPDHRGDMTAGELHMVVRRKLREAGLPVPMSSWNAVRLELGIALGAAPLGIRKTSRLGPDLGMG